METPQTKSFGRTAIVVSIRLNHNTHTTFGRMVKKQA
ncbi:protein of unknown function (plasmid) [Azospirillum baldaniorum]|uniref:Uncharacterized protein n=1 Tax=Azospirillum baldaniorum TaxID=1064539 RepID=A0A9P1JYI5_9PROT|nr:protein of unknown function [Azospirillum baldaniorum]